MKVIRRHRCMATVRQKAAFEKILEKPRSIGTVMREVGYSENTIVDPKNLTESDGWKELTKKYLPNEDLAKVHKEGLNATKKVFKNNNESGEIELVGEEPDFAVRHKYLDTAYKVKGSYAPEKSVNLTMSVDVKLTRKEQELKDEYEKKIQESYLNE